MWLEIGRSDPRRFFDAVVAVIWASRAFLALSAVLLTAGAWMGALGRPDLHMWAMSAGLLSFYMSVMYVQLPGFINAAPAVPATAALSAAFAAGLLLHPAAGYAAFAPFSLLYILLYSRALRGKPAHYPNAIHVAGLAALPLAGSHLEAVAAFPLASVLTLLYRIDSSRGRRRFTAPRALAVATGLLASLAGIKAGIPWLLLVPVAAVTAAAPPRLRDIYGAGSAIFRLMVPLAALDHHILYMAFAIIMATLCIPYFVPSVAYREAPRYGPELAVTAVAASAARLAGLLWPAAALVTALTAYSAIKAMSQRKVELKRPR